MIGQGISDANRSLIEDFERIYPDYEVWATVIYCGFVGPSGDVPRTPENRSENATVYSRETGKPVTLAGISITETLFLAEVMIKEQQIHGSRIQFDPRIVDRYTPTDILEAGWRCRHFWKGSDQNVPFGPYRLGLVNAAGEHRAIEWDQPWIALSLLVDDIRQTTETNE